MLTLLMQTNRRYTVSDLAERLEVDRRTIYRYIHTFNEAGFVVQTSQRYVRLAQTTQIHRQLSELLYFNQEEALTLYNAIDAIESDTERKTELKRKLATIYGTKAVQEKLIRLEKSRLLKTIMQAIGDRRRAVLVGYSSPSSNTTADRLVEPFSLSDDKQHVWAYEVSTGQNKLFKLSRAEAVRELEEPWLMSMHHRKGYTDAFRIISLDGETLPARIIMNRRACNLLREEYPLTQQDIAQLADDLWVYEARVSSYVGIGRFVLGLADCITVETPALREWMRDFAQRYILDPPPAPPVREGRGAGAAAK